MNTAKRHNLKISIPLAVIVMLTTIVYQRTTGPTYPASYTVVAEDQRYEVRLLRSHGGETDAQIELPVITGATATITYKRYPTNDAWTTRAFRLDGDRLVATLPVQPPAGKHTYYVKLTLPNGETKEMGSESDPVYIRFKGDVPAWILAPHILFMFLAMILSSVALFEAIQNTDMIVRLTQLTTGSLVIGGMILGPLVQKHAFGVYWAGFPYDTDLTDNKLLVGVIAWTIALALNWKAKNAIATIVAAIVLLGVYSIPHSMQGSQFDYEKGKVITTEDH